MVHVFNSLKVCMVKKYYIVVTPRNFIIAKLSCFIYATKDISSRISQMDDAPLFKSLVYFYLLSDPYLTQGDLTLSLIATFHMLSVNKHQFNKKCKLKI